MLDYYEAVEGLNGYIIEQWSVNEIDVRNPKDDDEQTKFATSNYAKKLAKVKYYEAALEESKVLKDKGFSNADIINYAKSNVSVKIYTKQLNAEKFRKMLMAGLPKNGLRAGEKNAFVFEMQKLLVKKGYDIPIDGMFKYKTSNALKTFEENNQLFPDRKIDALTLNLLLQ